MPYSLKIKSLSRPIISYIIFKKLIVNYNSPDLFVKENLDQYFKTIIVELLVTTFTGPKQSNDTMHFIVFNKHNSR